jgi:hypothetical protein
MSTISVWVLVIASSANPSYKGHIDNIATKEECLRLVDVVELRTRHQGVFCMEVRKALK